MTFLFMKFSLKFYRCGKILAINQNLCLSFQHFFTHVFHVEISKSIKDVILDEPKKSGEPTEPVIYEPEDKSHLTKWDKCKIWCCNAYHPYKKLPMLKWIQVTLSIKVMQLIQNDDSSLMSHHFRQKLLNIF